MKRFLLIIMFSSLLLAQNALFAQYKRDRANGGVEETISPEMNVVNNILYIKNAPIGAKLQVISIVGNKVREIEMKNSEGVYELNLPRAIYIFKLEGMVRKFVIR
ncbi:MAG: hypothetical protein FWF52_02185 [Candidatus Azobacteroides sp.]|nr:hypothetical protein [Candidatus Azobacteroides sp.]